MKNVSLVFSCTFEAVKIGGGGLGDLRDCTAEINNILREGGKNSVYYQPNYKVKDVSCPFLPSFWKWGCFFAFFLEAAISE